MSETLFNNTFEYVNEFSSGATAKSGLWSKAQESLWDVDDRVANNPSLRFQRSQNSFAEMIYDNGGSSVLNVTDAPDGLLNFLDKTFVGPLMLRHSKYVTTRDVAECALRYLDWQEPYFFLVDMPISLTQDNYAYTYRNKNTGSILSPEKLETFHVVRKWKFPHYMLAHRVMTDSRTSAIAHNQPVLTPDGSRCMTITDVLAHVGNAVFGNFSYLEGCVNEWSSQYYEDLRYDCNTGSVEEVNEIDSAEESDLMFWLACIVGTFTWLKSPHGLKFLIKYHPIYYELLDWDESRNIPIISKGTDGWCVVDSWSIYTSRDLDRMEGVKPGTCCVSNQQLHCTERINAKAVMASCYCGNPRNIHTEDYWADDRRDHHTTECKRWEKENPPQMVFVSYAAMYNILNKMDPQTRCQRHSCPNTSCSYHAGNYARIRALTERRTKMLTNGSAN